MSGARLRIAFVADTLYGPIGGGVIAGRHLVEKLREEHDVVVVGADANGPRDAKLEGFQFPLRAMRDMHFVLARPDRAVLARVCAQVDVVHLQFPFWLSFAALSAARAAGRPVVGAFHVQPENVAMNLGLHSERLNQAIYRLWLQHFYDRLDAVVCPTHFAKRTLCEHGLRAPAFVISNGVPPDLTADIRSLVSSSGQTLAEREPAYHGYFLILAVGRLAAEKHQEVVLDAVRRSRHKHRIQVVLAGDGPRRDDLRRLARELPNGAEIGFLPRDRLLRMFATADLFVHASEVELEGIAVIEAMSMGLPVMIAESAASAAAEFASSDWFRFPVRDAPALATKIDALIEHPEQLLLARRHSREIVNGLAFEHTVERYCDVYRRVIASRSQDAGVRSAGGAS